MNTLLNNIRGCEVCKEHLPLGPRPVVQLSEFSKIIIIGQAPGRRVHETGIPWNDASGKKLREWMHVDEATFYDPVFFSILPMGFCYPGKGISGDLPPRPECAPLWHPEVFKYFKSEPLILFIGQYAQRYYLKKDFKGSLTETVKNYHGFLPKYFPLPHPSPRNQNWVKINPWFMKEAIPELQKRVHLAMYTEAPLNSLNIFK
jgi:uracil-DNA glycosylase